MTYVDLWYLTQFFQNDNFFGMENQPGSDNTRANICSRRNTEQQQSKHTLQYNNHVIFPPKHCILNGHIHGQQLWNTDRNVSKFT